MTRSSVFEYAASLRQRYQFASNKMKTKMLDEFCQTTGYHRKAAIRLLRSTPAPRLQRRGRPRHYRPEIIEPLIKIWETANKICSKRLTPFIPELLKVLERTGELEVSPQVRSQLVQLSPATVDRLLKRSRPQGLRRPYSQSHSTPTIKAQVPIRTFGDWSGVAPGSLQTDLVLHCGDCTEGFYLTTLVGADVATGWTECQAVWGKNSNRVRSAIQQVDLKLPFRLRELHSDNGGEFLNQVLYQWCKSKNIHFTRGRTYKKNDQAYAEQKNWMVVRKDIGCDRYSTKAAFEQLQLHYALLRLYVNFFQPIRKLIDKERVGAKVTKRYDTARTPYQCLLEAGVLSQDQIDALRLTYERLNPVDLLARIESSLDQLWKLAERQPSSRSLTKGPLWKDAAV